MSLCKSGSLLIGASRSGNQTSVRPQQTSLTPDEARQYRELRIPSSPIVSMREENAERIPMHLQSAMQNERAKRYESMTGKWAWKTNALLICGREADSTFMAGSLSNCGCQVLPKGMRDDSIQERERFEARGLTTSGRLPVRFQEPRGKMQDVLVTAREIPRGDSAATWGRDQRGWTGKRRSDWRSSLK